MPKEKIVHARLWYALYDKDTNEASHELLIEKHKRVGLKYCNDSRAFIKYSNDIDDIYKKHKILIVSDDMITDI